ncbi:MAG: glycoside hydrolase family 95 protein [Verrucomicrobia bacterium]|nr:glycoside hydrolase family 95 protein [Verrucomicrobiota bacterium]
MDQRTIQKNSSKDIQILRNPATTLWFEQPATHFTQSLPLGNGRLGFMVFGGVPRERVILNEESVWSGSPFDDNRPNAFRDLPVIRNLLLAGKNTEAEAMVRQAFTCRGRGSGQGQAANLPFGCYQTLGNLWLEFDGFTGEPTDYRRQLDLRTAIMDVAYAMNGAICRRQVFISAPDQVGVIRLSANRPAALNLTVRLDRPEHFRTEAVNACELLMTGQLPDGQGGGGVRYAARLRLVPRGGKSEARENALKVIGADELLILFDAETDYHGNAPRDRRIEDPSAETSRMLDRAAGKPYEKLLADHIADYRGFFDRVTLKLADGWRTSIPTRGDSRRPRKPGPGNSSPALRAGCASICGTITRSAATGITCAGPTRS